MKDNKGFALFEMIIIIAVVGILGFAGYMVYDRTQNKKDNVATSQTASSTTEKKSDASDAPIIKKASDLKSAEQTLDATNVESSEEETQLDQDLSAL